VEGILPCICDELTILRNIIKCEKCPGTFYLFLKHLSHTGEDFGDLERVTKVHMSHRNAVDVYIYI